MGQIFAYRTAFQNPTFGGQEIPTICLGGWWMLDVFLWQTFTYWGHEHQIWFLWWNASTQRPGLGLELSYKRVTSKNPLTSVFKAFVSYSHQGLPKLQQQLLILILPMNDILALSFPVCGPALPSLLSCDNHQAAAPGQIKNTAIIYCTDPNHLNMDTLIYTILNRQWFTHSEDNAAENRKLYHTTILLLKIRTASHPKPEPKPYQFLYRAFSSKAYSPYWTRKLHWSQMSPHHLHHHLPTLAHLCAHTHTRHTRTHTQTHTHTHTCKQTNTDQWGPDCLVNLQTYVTRYHERYTKSLAANSTTRLNKLCDPILSISS